jgi:hypothetical protein
MSTLQSELQKLREIVRAFPARRVLPQNQIRPTRRMLERVLKEIDADAFLPDARLDLVKRQILEAQRSGAGLATLPRSILRDATAVLWPDAADGIDRTDLLHAILQLAESQRSALRRLIEAWILQFDPKNPSVQKAGIAIQRLLQSEHRGILEIWKDISVTYGFFDAATGPELLADRILEEDADALAAHRLDHPLRAVSGYLRATHFALSLRLPRMLRQDDASDTIRRSIRFYAPDGKLRFDEPLPNGAMADALVGAWSTKGDQPSIILRAEVLAFLKRHLGDPRIDVAQRWSGASAETRRTVRAWLSKLALDAFFNVVGRFARNVGMDHQWKSRENFWGQCLRKDLIRDSWLVLGDNVARAIAGHQELQGSYGRLSEGDANHSVLLMQIGNLVFAEWSHNGSLRAWPSDWKNAPSLFRSYYSRAELTAPCIQFPPPAGRNDLTTTGTGGLTHHAGTWQGRVAALLRSREGIRL